LLLSLYIEEFKLYRKQNEKRIAKTFNASARSMLAETSIDLVYESV
jgi:hypothetical protein